MIEFGKKIQLSFYSGKYLNPQFSYGSDLFVLVSLVQVVTLSRSIQPQSYYS